MYRNTYLELYKNSASQQDLNLTTLFTHFTQIYNTLGCVLQDLQFQIGKTILQNSIQQPKIQGNVCCMNGGKESRAKPVQEVIKIEETQLSHPYKSANLAEEKQKNKNSKMKSVKEESANMNKIQADKRLDNNSGLANTIKGNSQRAERLRGNELNKNMHTDSFDSLFSSSRHNNQLKQSQQQKNTINMPAIQQQFNQTSNLNVDNTYDDFLDRIFREQQGSRRNR